MERVFPICLAPLTISGLRCGFCFHEARKASIFLFSNSITNHIFENKDRHKITFSKCVLFEKSHFHEIVIPLDVVRERLSLLEKRKVFRKTLLQKCLHRKVCVESVSRGRTICLHGIKLCKVGFFTKSRLKV